MGPLIPLSVPSEMPSIRLCMFVVSQFAMTGVKPIEFRTIFGCWKKVPYKNFEVKPTSTIILLGWVT
jgi:hypothetical protein